MTESRAIATAVAVVKRWAAGGGNVDENTRAAARKALAEWEALKARAAGAKAGRTVKRAAFAEQRRGARRAMAIAERAIAEEDEKLRRAYASKWIKGAIKDPGALHRALGVPQGKPIPYPMLVAAAKKPGRVGKMARLALTLKKMKPGKTKRVRRVKGGK